METSIPETVKKHSIEHLSKEEIIKKYQDLIVILKKAIHNKEALTKENSDLKESIESLTSQKLSLVTNVQDLKTEKNALVNQYTDYEKNLITTKNKNSDLDTENQSLKRQTQRLNADNEQLLKHLDCLEKQLKENNFQSQQCDTLKLDKTNLCQELTAKETIICDLQMNNTELTQKCDDLKANIESLEKNYQNAEIIICELKGTIKENNEQREIYLSESDDLNTELHKNKALVEKLQQDLKTMSAKLTDNQIELSGYASDLQNTNEKLRDKIRQFHTKIVKLATDVKVLKQHKVGIIDSFKNYIQQVKVWEMQLKEYSEKMISELLHIRTQNLKLHAENENLSTTVSSSEEQLKMMTISYQNEKSTLLKNLEEMTTFQSNLENKLKPKETSEVGVQIDTGKQEVNSLKKENSELLLEMNEMNQALKARSELISKQEECHAELMTKVKEKDLNIKEILDTIETKNSIISDLEKNIAELKNKTASKDDSSDNTKETVLKKDEEIAQLRQEIFQLQEKVNSTLPLDSQQEINYAESETMSTSTISKTEEFNRLKDLEGSWEERYGKLRTLALKLKGKIRDLTAELNKEHNEKHELQQKLADSLKTYYMLHAQCDKLQDELEENKNNVNDYSKKLDAAALEISNTKKQLADSGETIIKLKSDIEVLQKEKTNTDIWKKQISSKVQNLRKEIDANNLLKKDFENQIANLNQQIEVKDKLLKEEIEKHNFTRNSLQESNIECKKQTVLNLEMQDYERSLKDLTQKLDKKQELINKLKNQIDSQKATVNTIKEENKGLEEQLKYAEYNLKITQTEIQAYKRNISELECVVVQKDEKTQNFIQTLETCRVENEDLSSQLSKVVAENQKSCNNLKIEKDYLRGQNMGLEQKLREVTDFLKLKEEELVEIKKEYNGYKVRAQSVLRQNQNRDVGLEEKLSEEVVALKSQTTNLTTELNDLRMKMKKITDENTNLKTENQDLLNKKDKLETSLTEVEKQQEILSAEQQKFNIEQAEVIRGLKLHADTLAQCYRQQLSEQEVRHNREIIELQSKLEKGASITEPLSILPPISSREEGEGSENVEETYSQSHPIPLNRLLSYESDQEVGFLKKQMNDNEAKITHLTALLADTEQDLAKHVQMNKLLKEEIRRQQRSVEREKHAENLEYLKNVVFKFATLSSGDERSRLVPVLNTILKFSPEEIHKLNIVARNEVGNRGWSNYIPIWSSISERSPTTEIQVVPEEENHFKCDICHFRFNDGAILELHQQLLHQTAGSKQTKYNYNCHLCQKQFRMRGSLMVHLRVAHFSYIQNNYKKLNISDVEDVVQKQSTDKRKTLQDKNWECDVCSKLFTTKYFLKKHKRLHTGEMPYYCAQCNKYFTFQQSYHKHMLYHSDSKPHVCTECGRAFKELSTLHNHERIHSGERPFSCETCGKRFRQRVSYLVHCRIHTGAMPYKCTACQKSFRYKISQRSHKCTVDPPGNIVKQPDFIENLNQKNQTEIVIESTDNLVAENMSLFPLDNIANSPSTNENLDVFNLTLSPILAEVQSMCLSNHPTISREITINNEEMTVLQTINEESFRELLRGLPHSF